MIKLRLPASSSNQLLTARDVNLNKEIQILRRSPPLGRHNIFSKLRFIAVPPSESWNLTKKPLTEIN